MHFDFAPVIEDLNFVSVQGRYKGNFEILVGFGSMFTPAFHVHVSAFFFFFFPRVFYFLRQLSLFMHCSITVHTLFMGPTATLFRKKY